jgi:hypothetical protein
MYLRNDAATQALPFARRLRMVKRVPNGLSDFSFLPDGAHIRLGGKTPWSSSFSLCSRIYYAKSIRECFLSALGHDARDN